jgi:hypothetical protein
MFDGTFSGEIQSIFLFISFNYSGLKAENSTPLPIYEARYSVLVHLPGKD